MPTSCYAPLKEQLLALPGVSAQPPTGKGSAGIREEFHLAGRLFVTLQLADTFVTVHAGPILEHTRLAEQLKGQLQYLRTGRASFKVTDVIGVVIICDLFQQGARQWGA